MCPKLYLGYLFFIRCSPLWNSDQLLPWFYFFALISVDLILNTLDICSCMSPISYLSNEIPVGSKEIGWFDFSFTLYMVSPWFWMNEKYRIYPSRFFSASFSYHSLHECPRNNLFWKIPKEYHDVFSFFDFLHVQCLIWIGFLYWEQFSWQFLQES